MRMSVYNRIILFCQWTRVANTGMLGFVSICTGFGTECGIMDGQVIRLCMRPTTNHYRV